MEVCYNADRKVYRVIFWEFLRGVIDEGLRGI